MNYSEKEKYHEYLKSLAENPIITAEGRLKIISLKAAGGFGVIFDAELNGNPCIAKCPSLDNLLSSPDILREINHSLGIEKKALDILHHSPMTTHAPQCFTLKENHQLKLRGNKYSITILVMQFIEGTNLGEEIGPNLNEALYWSIFDTTKLLKSLFEGIKVLANNNIVHRDIKPDNIIIIGFTRNNPSENFTTILIDFGISSNNIGGRKTRNTYSTPGYSHPKQRKANTTPHSYYDLYASVIVCIEALSGFNSDMWLTFDTTKVIDNYNSWTSAEQWCNEIKIKHKTEKGCDQLISLLKNLLKDLTLETPPTDLSYIDCKIKDINKIISISKPISIDNKVDLDNTIEYNNSISIDNKVDLDNTIDDDSFILPKKNSEKHYREFTKFKNKIYKEVINDIKFSFILIFFSTFMSGSLIFINQDIDIYFIYAFFLIGFLISSISVYFWFVKLYKNIN